MNNQWYFKMNGTVTGPMDSARIVSLIQTGEIPPHVLVSGNRWGDWLPAMNHACFQVPVYLQPHQDVPGMHASHGAMGRPNLASAQSSWSSGKIVHVLATTLFATLAIAFSVVAAYLWINCNTKAEASALREMIRNLSEEKSQLNEQVAGLNEQGTRKEQEIHDLRQVGTILETSNQQAQIKQQKIRKDLAQEMKERKQSENELAKSSAKLINEQAKRRTAEEAEKITRARLDEALLTTRDLQVRETAQTLRIKSHEKHIQDLRLRINALINGVNELNGRIKGLQQALHKTKGEVFKVGQGAGGKWAMIDLGTMRAQKDERYRVLRKGQIVGHLRVHRVEGQQSFCFSVDTYAPQVGDKVLWAPEAVAVH